MKIAVTFRVISVSAIAAISSVTAAANDKTQWQLIHNKNAAETILGVYDTFIECEDARKEAEPNPVPPGEDYYCTSLER